MDQIFGIMPDGKQGKIPGHQYIKMSAGTEGQLFHFFSMIIYYTKEADRCSLGEVEFEFYGGKDLVNLRCDEWESQISQK